MDCPKSNTVSIVTTKETRNVFDRFRNIYLAVFSANLLALCSDATIAWSSPVLIKLNQTGSDNPFGTPITDTQISWITSTNTLGLVFGPLPCMLAADKFGRRYLLLLLAVPHAVSFIMLAFSSNMTVWYVARFLGGLSAGSAFTILPVYFAEITENSNRGMFGVSMSFFCSLGDLISYSIGPYTSLICFNLILFSVPVLYFISFGICSPESPYYLVSKNRLSEAKTTLISLRSHPEETQIDEEIQAIKKIIENDNQGHFMDIIKEKHLRKALLISVSLLAFQQTSGIFAVIYYTQTIFEASGSSISSDISAIIVGTVLLVGMSAVPLLVDRIGRKILLIFSAVGMAVAEIGLAIYFIFYDKTETDLSNLSWLPVVSLVVYIFTHQSGFGIIPLTIMSEIFPSNVKSVATSLTSIVGYGFGFLITNFFVIVSSALGMGGSFLIFVFSNIVAVLFVIFVVPETKGKSFDEIQEILKGNKTKIPNGNFSFESKT